MIYLYKCRIDSNYDYQKQHQITLKLLEMHFGYLPEIEISEKGKPYFSELDIGFSVSHCKKMVVVAIAESDDEIGVDVEIVRNCNELVMKRMYHENEINMVQGDNDFTKIWVCKESYGKKLGVGVLYDMKSYDFSKILTNNMYEPSDYCIQVLMDDNVYICICSGYFEEVVGIDVTPDGEKT